MFFISNSGFWEYEYSYLMIAAGQGYLVILHKNKKQILSKAINREENLINIL